MHAFQPERIHVVNARPTLPRPSGDTALRLTTPPLSGVRVPTYPHSFASFALAFFYSTSMALTAKQQRFVAEYLIDLNATQAAIRSGYSEKTANEQGARLLANVSVAQAVQQAINQRSERTQVTADYVLRTIVETIERCKQAEPVRDRDGEATGEYKFEAGAVLKGAELLGKHLKMFTDKTELTGADGKPIEFTGITRRIIKTP
jgi:phage terminase small subunit